MHDPRGRGRTEAERSPIVRLSSVGQVTTGWRSSLETTPRKSFASFVIETLIAAGVFMLLVLILVWFSGGFAGPS